MFNETKKTNIAYWIFTALICLMQGSAVVMEFMHHPEMVDSMKTLGYPTYLLYILGTAKSIGLIAILIPKFPRLKEWAYAGFAIDFVAAFASHMFVGDGIDKTAPALVALVILMLGYVFRPESRRLQG